MSCGFWGYPFFVFFFFLKKKTKQKLFALYQLIKTLSQNIESNFDNLNDRITVLANKQKCSDQASTSALADIHQDVKLLRSDVDKQTNSILSKAHVLIEKLIETPNLARHRYKSDHETKTPHQEKSSQSYTSQDPVTKPPIRSPEKEQK